MAPPCLFVCLSISGAGRGPGVCAELYQGRASVVVLVALLVPAILYYMLPSLLAGLVRGIKERISSLRPQVCVWGVGGGSGAKTTVVWD